MDWKLNKTCEACVSRIKYIQRQLKTLDKQDLNNREALVIQYRDNLSGSTWEEVALGKEPKTNITPPIISAMAKIGSIVKEALQEELFMLRAKLDSLGVKNYE